MRRLVIFMIFTLSITRTVSEYFSGSSTMEKLAADEKSIIEDFRVFYKKLQVENHYLSLKLKSWQQASEKAIKNPEKLVHNPVSAYLMIKRLSKDIDLMQNRIYEIIDEFKKKIRDIRPTSVDMVGAVEGLLRTQSIYHLKSSDIIEGIVDGEQLVDRLTTHDIFTIAKEASNIPHRRLFAEEYLRFANASIANGEDIFSEVKAEEISKVAEIIEKKTKSDPLNETFANIYRYNDHDESIIYSKACRRKILKTPAESKELRCRYVSNSAFSKIAPFKMIEADKNSNLVVFLDILSENEIEFLKNISKLKLERAAIYSNTYKDEISNTRVSQVAWFYDEEYALVAKISKRIEDMTGLSTKTAERLQMQNYGVGGHFTIHWDMILKEDKTPKRATGNRIATLLFYMSTVLKGGATIFPYMKVYVPAIKGSAAFWFNLKDSGDEDYYTKHAACPVLLGTKWVANRWFHEREQEFRRPCRPGKFMENTLEGFKTQIFPKLAKSLS